MKEEYDFTDAEQGRFYRPIEALDISTVKLLKQYMEASISTGEIAQRLNMTRDEVLSLMQQNEVALADYDFSEDETTLLKYVRMSQR